jgi:hypothetical protein
MVLKEGSTQYSCLRQIIVGHDCDGCKFAHQQQNSKRDQRALILTCSRRE